MGACTLRPPRHLACMSCDPPLPAHPLPHACMRADKHINHLDSDLQQLDTEIEADRKELGLQVRYCAVQHVKLH